MSTLGNVFWLLPQALERCFGISVRVVWDLFFWSHTQLLWDMWQGLPCTCFLERRASAFYSEIMQTLQHTLRKSKLCLRQSDATYECPKIPYVSLPNVVLGASISYSRALIFGTSCEVLIKLCLGVVWRATLILLWRAWWCTQPPRIDFLEPWSLIDHFYSLRWLSALFFGLILTDLFMFLVSSIDHFSTACSSPCFGILRPLAVDTSPYNSSFIDD